MASEEIFERLANLTEREREVLALVCQAVSYHAIGEQLHIEVGTVKTHMSRVYVKLGLVDLERREREKLLFQECCPALEAENLPPPPEEPEDPEPVPDIVLNLVEADEKALMVVEGEIIDVAPPTRQPLLVRVLTGVARFVIRLVVIAVLVSVVGVVGVYFILRETGIVDVPPVAELVSPVVEQIPLIPALQDQESVPGATATLPPTSEPEDGGEVAEVVSQPSTNAPQLPTATRQPTNTPRPTVTPHPTNTPTPQNTGLLLGQSYAAGNILVTVEDVDFRELGDPFIGIAVKARNTGDQTITFEYGNEDFRLEDNLGNTYFTRGGSFSRGLTINPGQSENVHSLLCCRLFFDVDHTNAAITQITLIITDFSSIEQAEWELEIQHG